MMNDLMYVGMGGALGAICRYLTVQWVGVSDGQQFPFGTFLVNLVGCFLIAVAVVWMGSKMAYSEAWRLIAVNGFLGAYTTFSAFSLDAYQLVNGGHVAMAAIYVVATLIACLSATAAAFYLFK